MKEILYAVQMHHLTDELIEVKPVPYEDSLEEMYRLCDCDTIDIISLRNHIPEFQHIFEGIVLDNESIDIVLDDNGKIFKKPCTLPLFYEHRVYDIINGDIIFIIGNNDTGETYGYSRYNIDKIMSAIELYTMQFKSPLKYVFGKMVTVEVPEGFVI